MNQIILDPEQKEWLLKHVRQAKSTSEAMEFLFFTPEIITREGFRDDNYIDVRCVHGGKTVFKGEGTVEKWDGKKLTVGLKGENNEG